MEEQKTAFMLQYTHTKKGRGKKASMQRKGGGREEVREKGGKQERRKEIKERNAKGWERERRIKRERRIT